MSLHPTYPRRSRPTAPSCRGGVSSVLRLAQPPVRNSDFAGLAQRVAEALAPFADWPSVHEATTSIITPLAPSRSLGAR